MHADRPPPRRRRRSRLRKFGTQLGVTLALLLVAELVARVLLPAGDVGADPYVGFAGDAPWFVLDEAAGEYVTNPERARHFNPQRFAAAKPDGTRRVACVGGSTTYGRPYRDATSFPGWLRAALPRAAPGERFEVINAGGVSYASYRVARVVDELLRHDLDLLVIYTGHNEFLEARTYGEELKHPGPLRRLAAALDGSALFRAARGLVGVERVGPAPSTTLPDEVAPLLDASVGLDAYTRDDALADDVLAHYDASLRRMLDAAAAVDVPVLLVAPASQLVGCAPFKSAPDPSLDAAQRDELARLVALAADDARPYDERRLAALAAARLSPRHALAAYLDGELALRAADFEHAALALRRARDEDLVPLRAPSRFVQRVRSLAAERAEREVFFVDAELLLARRARTLTGVALPGPESFLDHVHMTPEAYAELAFALLDELVARDWLAPAPDFDADARAQLVAEGVAGLGTEDHVRALERLAAVLDWAGKRAEAERVSLRAQELGGDQSAFSQWQQGHFARARGDLQAAADAYARALEIDPGYTEAALNRGEVMLRLSRPAEARAHFEQVLADDPALLAARFGLGVALGMLGERHAERAAYRAVLDADPVHADAWNRLALSLEADGRAAEARQTLASARAAVPDDASLAYNHGVLLERAGEADAAAAAYRAALAADPEHAGAAKRLARLAPEAPR